MPVRLVAEDDPTASVIGVKRVDELDFYNLLHHNLTDHLCLTGPKVTAAIRYTSIQGDLDFHKRIKFGASTFDRYSQNAITKLRAEINTVGIDTIWAEAKPQTRRRR